MSNPKRAAREAELAGNQAELFPDLPSVKLPKRVKTKWEELNELCDLVEEHGPIIPIRFAGELLDLSHQRVTQLANAGQLSSVEFRGRRWVAEKEIRRFIELERKPGRPRAQVEQIAA